MLKKIVLKLMKPINSWLYPIAARKSMEEWHKLTDLEFALLLIDANPESAEILASFYIKKHNLKTRIEKQDLKQWRCV